MPNPIDELLRRMNAADASDLFVAVGRSPALRRHGQVLPLDVAATSSEELEQFLARALTPASRNILRETGDLDVGYSHPTGSRFRLNLARQRGKLSLVARAVPSGALDFDSLRLPAAIEKLAELQRGLVLVTGATGSGKSTTLAAIVHHINRTRSAHIVTIEDPIEFVHVDDRARLTQREVGPDTGSFHQALRGVVRQSPDVILLGELRDLETMQVALSAALTGHLVLTTLHTIDTTQTLQRLLSYFPEHLREQAAMDLSLSIQGVVSQRLVPHTEPGEQRVVAVEMMTAGPAVRRLIKEQRIDDLTDLMRQSRDPGMTTFNEALLELYRRGEISFDVGRAYATNPEEFALTAQGMASGVGAFRTDDEDAVAKGLDMRALLAVAAKRGASDLHLTVGRPPILRITGELRAMRLKPLTAGDMRMLLYSVLSQRQRTQYELEKEIDFALALSARQRFRVNAYYQKGHMAAALRAIPTKIPDADTLHLPDTVLTMGAHPHGLLLVCGPTGSGKSTTLACLLDRINRSRACRILTIEDPIEYTHVSRMATVDQREVHSDTLGFSAALKYVLRQDPDVILIGEMRDLETVSAALTAAETGHMVLATLHSNDAPQTIDRVVDVFPPHQQQQARSQLAASLIGVVSQRLLPRKDGPGRIPAFELMIGTPAIKAQVRDGKMHQALATMESSRGAGMVTLDRSLQDLMRAGKISYEDAVRYCRNPKAMGPPPQG